MRQENPDRMKIMMEHTQKMRQSITNPSKETLAAWRLDDARKESILRIHEMRETQEADEIIITSEAK